MYIRYKELLFEDYRISDLKWPLKMSDDKLLVATVDFGNTYSGFAFCIGKEEMKKKTEQDLPEKNSEKTCMNSLC